MHLTSPAHLANTIPALLAAPSGFRSSAAVSFGPPASHDPPFPLTPAASARVGIALAAAVRTHDAAMRELQTAIEGCVAELHGQGMLPEVALVTMKAFVRHTAVLHPPPGRTPSRYAADAFMDEIVHWCIVAYFRHRVPPDGPPPADAGGNGG